MRVGYRRTSTGDQIAGYESQLRDLKAAKCEKIFGEQLSSVDAHREQLDAAIDFCRDGDTLVCTRLDRLARSVADVVAIEKRLCEKGVALEVMDPKLETTSPTGRLLFNLIASIAQFEREVMLSRQREGVAKARADGKYLGRKPTAQLKADEIRRLNAEGLGASAIARKLGLHRASVHRVLSGDSEAVEARLEGKLKAWRDKAKGSGQASVKVDA
jgi:DNA invertase Pin-like site-specific DNA recombinase